MAEYGTIEYYREQIKKLEMEKEVLLNALENIVRKDFPNFDLVDQIIEKISNINYDLKWSREELEKLYSEKLEGKSEQNDN